MYYQYLAWENDRHLFKGHFFLPSSKIKNMLSTDLLLRDYDVFTSIQVYDENGNTIKCPFYVDIDGKDAKKQANLLYTFIKERFKMSPNVYFSGNKGYHLIIPVFIDGENCHQVVKEMIKSLINECSAPLNTVDMTVYTSRRLFRVNGSYHSKSNKRKKQLVVSNSNKKTEQFKVYEENARKIIAENKARYEDSKKHTDPSKEKNYVYPCIKKLLKSTPEDGEYHNTVYTLLRFFKSIDVPEEQAICVLLSQKHFKEDEIHVRKVAKSHYASSDNKTVGCKTGQNAELLRKHCSVWCFHNKENIPFILED